MIEQANKLESQKSKNDNKFSEAQVNNGKTHEVW